MRAIDLRQEVQAVHGNWRSYDTLNVWNILKNEIYRSEAEPSYVCWAILWTEAEGTLKLSFTEVAGDLTSWPPSYNFNRPGMEYYLKTLQSSDGGQSWEDTGWKERLDERWDLNADHHIRHVFQIENGQLIRNFCRTQEGFTVNGNRATYDEAKSWEAFPFEEKPNSPVLKKLPTIWTSGNGGEAWEQIYSFPAENNFFITGFHPLRNGSILAVGAVNPSHVNAFDKNWVSITESWDKGKTWSPVQKLLTNDDYLVPQGMCEEFDFVELDDGRLLMIMRTDGLSTHMLQTYLEREDSGQWKESTPTTNALFKHSGYPYMRRASDGTIFYYTLQNILYTCDDGASWNELEIGNSYYGQIAEVSPGKMLAVTQRNIGDAAFQYVHDAYMLQTTFEYARTAVIEQTDSVRLGAVSVIGEESYDDFHLYAEVRADGETGIAFQVNGDSYYFAAIVIPCNEFRSPGAAAGQEQDAYLLIGMQENGAVTILRRIMLERMQPHAWIGMQMDMQDGVLKAAVKKSADSPAKYVVIKEDAFSSGKLGLFTNRSTGAFKNMKIASESMPLRSNWGDYADAYKSLDGKPMKEKEY
ncbi:sialidase family protein [Paenibacillus mendelii]|uniref:Sialidase family protein n=1 Tax=Paenibacillus mendelii TaxID=206163 RepID=A0ABV6JFS0_9BACL|nr:sialidase family protein [Paenibacillus mendelii]MCQ6557648.1 glycoside hydrolase [Paenibacillus mendelii]